MHDAQTTRPAHKPVLGLTGAPGSGKSTVARMFADLGCAVIDADQLAHAALQSDEVRGRLVDWWGEEVLDDSGAVSRAAVGRIVFDDREQLKRLESLVHPRVHAGRAQTRARWQSDPGVRAIVEDCPLLMETGLDKQCDAVVFIDVPDAVRLARLRRSRGWDAGQVQKREQFQLPLDTKRRSADYVIDNGEPIEQVRQQVEQVLTRALGTAA